MADLRRACLVGLLAIPLYPLMPFRSLTEASKRGYRVSGLLLGQSILITGLALLFANFGWGISGQFLAMVLGTIPFHVTLARDGLRSYPRALFSAYRGEKDSETERQLWSLQKPTFAMNLSDRISWLSDNIVIALILQPSVVVPFFITQRLIQLAQTQLQGLGQATWAALAELHAQGKQEIFNRRLIELTSLVVALSVASLVPIGAYNHHFIRRWIGAEFYGGHLVTIVAALNVFLLAVLALWRWSFICAGKVRLLVPVSLAGGAINLTASVLLTRDLGLIGPLLGTSLSLGVTSAWYLPMLLHRVWGVPLRELIRAVALPLAWALPYTAGVWWVAGSHEPRGWSGLMAEMAAAALVYVAIWWGLVLVPAERIPWIERVRGLLTRDPSQ